MQRLVDMFRRMLRRDPPQREAHQEQAELPRSLSRQLKKRNQHTRGLLRVLSELAEHADLEKPMPRLNKWIDRKRVLNQLQFISRLQNGHPKQINIDYSGTYTSEHIRPAAQAIWKLKDHPHTKIAAQAKEAFETLANKFELAQTVKNELAERR